MLTINPPGLPHVFPFCLWIVSPRGPVTFMVRCFSLLNGSGLISPLIALWFVLTCLFPVCQTVRNLRAGTTFYSCLHLCLFRDPCKARHRVCAWMSTPPHFFFFFSANRFYAWMREWMKKPCAALPVKMGSCCREGSESGCESEPLPWLSWHFKSPEQSREDPSFQGAPPPSTHFLSSTVRPCWLLCVCVYMHAHVGHLSLKTE